MSPSRDHCPHEDRTALRQPSLRRGDVFVLVNLAGFLLLGTVFALAGMQRYDGPANVPEFFIYACVIMAVIAAAWPRLRSFAFPVGLLVLVEAGLVAHFAGAFVPVGGGRLYDQVVFGIGYDNVVHALNAFAGAALIDHLLRQYRLQPALWRWIVVGLVLGAGAAVEIVEYLALLIVPDAGVGGYDNNMRDLVADLAGAVAFLPFMRSPGKPA